MEKEFLNDYINELKELEKKEVQLISTYALGQVEYVERVGRIFAYRQASETFLHILKKYFPST